MRKATFQKLERDNTQAEKDFSDKEEAKKRAA